MLRKGLVGARAKRQRGGHLTLATPREGGFQSLVTGVKALGENMGGEEASRGGAWPILGPSLVKGKGPHRPPKIIVRVFVQRKMEAMDGGHVNRGEQVRKPWEWRWEWETGTEPLCYPAPALSHPQGAGLPDRRAVPGPGEASGPERLHHRWRHGYGGPKEALGMGSMQSWTTCPAPPLSFHLQTW